MSDETLTPLGKRGPGRRMRRMFTATPSIVRPSALFHGNRLEQGQPLFERCIGASLLGLSIAGTIALFNGGWGVPRLGPFFWGLFGQGLLTLTQWMYRRRRMTWQYLSALLIDTGLSIGGYASVLLPPLETLFGRSGLPTLAVQSVALVFLLAAGALLAYIPERILVTD